MNIPATVFIILSVILLLMVVSADTEREKLILNCHENGGVLISGVGLSPYICIDKGIIIK